MPKADTQTNRVRAARNSLTKLPALPAPFRLNREGQRALALHQRYEAARQAAEAALRAERPASWPRREHAPSVATQALCDAWHSVRDEITSHMNALVERIDARKKRTAADVVTLFIAGLHSSRARHPLTEALDAALGLGLTCPAH